MPENNNTPGEPTPEVAPTTAPAEPSEEPTAAALSNEVSELKDRLVRTLAEMENLRKRTEREVADSRRYAVASFARDMLTVSDNLKRAIDAVPEEMRQGGDKVLTALIEGVEVTERGFEQSLEKFGVRAIDAKGEKFNPDLHQAVYEVESADIPAGHVADVMQVGYVIGERVLRPAMVGVAKASSKPVAAPANDDKIRISTPDQPS